MKIKLRQAFDLQMGKTPARNRPDYWNGDHKWISIADIGNAGKFLTKTKESITEAGIDGSGIKVVPQGTVIMSFKLSIGKTAITSEDMYTNEAIMAFIDNGKFAIDTDYLYHLCCGTNWTAGTNKAVMGLTLNKATLLEKEIPLPDINEQHEIATKLDKIDAIIAERQQQLELIDQAVKSRFIELFGDMESNPKGWRESTLGTECYYIKDGPHKSPPYIDDQNGIPFISTRNVVNGDGIDWSTAKYISEADYLQCIKKCKPEKGDILYSKGGTTGIAKYVDTDKRFANWVHVAVLKFGDQLDGRFLERMLNMDYCYRQSQQLTKGIANRDFVLSAIAQVKIFVPPIELQRQYVRFVEQTDKSKLAVQKGLQELEILKKSLMQQYFG